MKDKFTRPSCPETDRSALTRRDFIRGSAALLGASWMGALAGCGGDDASAGPAAIRASSRQAANPAAYLMPGEDAPHAATYMAFASGSEGIWTPLTAQSTDAGIDRVRADLMDVAKAIGTYEPASLR